MGERRLLIAAWGLPWTEYCAGVRSWWWEEVAYVFEDEQKERSRSTLKPLIEKLQPDGVVVVVQDTVYAEKMAVDYRELQRQVEEMYREAAKVMGIDGVDFVVVPGKGNFRNKGCGGEVALQIEGRLVDFKHYAYYKLASWLLERLGSEEKVKIALDLSHGMNYMPTLLYYAVEDLAQMTAYVKEVELEVYNSDPHIKGVQSLTIHKVLHRREVKPMVKRMRFRGRVKPLKFGKMAEVKASEVAEEIDKLPAKELNAFVGAVVHGLPLVLAYAFPDTARLRDALRRAEEFYIDNTKVEAGDGWVKIRHGVSLTEDFEHLARVWYLASILEKFAGMKRSRDKVCDVGEIAERVFGKDEALRLKIGYELYAFDYYVDKRQSSCGQSLWDPHDCVNILQQKDRFRRNFHAHAGLQICVTERTEDGCLRYKADALDYVYEASSLGLEDVS